MIHVENLTQFEQTIEKGITLVDFYATWCGPCRMLAPFVEEIEVDYTDKIQVAKVDVDECGDIASKYGINAIPALLLFQDGELIKTNVGFLPKEEIVNIVESILAK